MTSRSDANASTTAAGGSAVPSRIGVVGAGLMGGGIAQVSAVAGHSVVLRDISDEAVARGLGAIESSLARLEAKGRIAPGSAEEALARITGTTELDALADVDLVVEAVFEKVELKTELFVELDRICRPDAVLATNTSAIPITTIAAATSRPEAVVGTHFFSPVPLMRLCEVVRGFKTSEDTLARAVEFAEGVGKTVVVVNRDVAGFVTTRLITALTMEAVSLVESGVVSAEDLDIACRLGFGHAMGPLETADMTGVEIMLNATSNIYADSRDGKFAPPESLLRMVAAGDLGRKTGRGFYDYSQEDAR